jgi:hypothetical protein
MKPIYCILIGVGLGLLVKYNIVEARIVAAVIAGVCGSKIVDIINTRRQHG